MKKIIAPIVTLVTLLVPTIAMAAPAEGGEANGWVAIAMGLAIGLAALGGGMGQGRAAAGALEGIARNPGSSDKVFTPMLLCLAFVESLVIFALVIAFMLNGRL